MKDANELDCHGRSWREEAGKTYYGFCSRLYGFGLFRKPSGSGPVRQGEAFRSVPARPDGLAGVSRPSRGSKDLARGTVAMAGLMTGVAWLIPYCARHHPLHLEEQRVPGTFLSARCASTGDEPGRPASPPFVSRSSFSLKSPPTRKPEDPRFGTLLASLPALRTPNSWSGIDRRRAMRHIIRRQASILLQRIHKTLCAWPLLCYDSGQRLRTATQPGRP